MEYTIEHQLPGRIRLRCPPGSFSQSEAYAIAAILKTQSGVLEARASHRTGSLLIRYSEGHRDEVLKAVDLLDRSFYGPIDGTALAPSPGGSIGESLASVFVGLAVRALMPRIIRSALTIFRAMPLLRKGLHSLLARGQVNVSVLDASAVGVSLMRRDFRTATVITTLLTLGDMLEEWTHKRSQESLGDSLTLKVDQLWIRRDGCEVQIPMKELAIGDCVVVRTGSVIPVDGVVVDGDAMVDQSAMTGESTAIRRTPGLSVYAGTLVEDGELAVRVTAFDSDTRIHKIAAMIDESEGLKAEVQSRAERMADAIVPWSFLLAGGIYFLTGSAVRAVSALLVDYSCAIKLATPLAILAAMREGLKRGVLIKGGRFLEAIASAETFVFDKTGTLTVSTPSVAEVVPFEGYDHDEVLRTAACLEEHFPHSLARAVVRQAELEALSHKEKHSTIEYIAAHGIVSHIGADKVLLGSAHFVFEDMGIVPSPEQQAIIERKRGERSMLYLAIGDRLAGFLCIEDPLRQDAAETIRRLHDTGVKRVVMLTGDNPYVARAVAGRVGVDETMAQLLPEDKTRLVKQWKQEGGSVVMVGDGINDSPALAAADVSIAMRSGADITQAVADIVLTDNRLTAIADARLLGAKVMQKIRRNYTFIVGANTLLLALGTGGAITPGTAALLHNLVTLGAGAFSLTPLLPSPSTSMEADA